MLGFSSGGHLVAAISTHFMKRIYSPVDAADAVSCRPDFAVPIYPGHLSLHAAEWDARQGKSRYVMPASVLFACKDHELCLNPEVPVSSQTPPTFLLQNEDDHVDNVDDALSYYIALRKVKVPVEMHLYARARACRLTTQISTVRLKHLAEVSFQRRGSTRG